MEEHHLVLVSMPKSASVFVRAAIELSAGLERHSFGGPMPFLEHTDALAFQRFLEAPKAQGGEHMAASAYNLGLLREGGIKRITLLLRDPRDALVSWQHNLERADVVRLKWHRPMLVADGQIPADYYDLDKEQKFYALVRHYLPRLLEWRSAWLAVDSFDIQVVDYADMVGNEDAFVRNILDFHEIEAPTISLPVIDKTVPLDGKTHFRRGIVGSHVDELSAHQRLSLELNLPR